ncbi:XRE family transcriptional regulator [Sinorhizobium chiapasense]|uniref:XRE family transcriptional regulator n=1 Tax=Sinorhizobium chiapasense TaxID=501572 RepID=A0ABZ2B6N6_9HYPH
MRDDEPTSPEMVEAMIAGLQASGMRPSAIAREAQLSRMTIWRLTVGEGRRPSHDTVRRLERLYEARCRKP